MYIMHAVENAIVNIPALSTPFIRVTAIIKNKELKAFSPVPNVFHKKFFLNYNSFSIIYRTCPPFYLATI